MLVFVRSSTLTQSRSSQLLPKRLHQPSSHRQTPIVSPFSFGFWYAHLPFPWHSSYPESVLVPTHLLSSLPGQNQVQSPWMSGSHPPIQWQLPALGSVVSVTHIPRFSAAWHWSSIFPGQQTPRYLFLSASSVSRVTGQPTLICG